MGGKLKKVLLWTFIVVFAIPLVFSVLLVAISDESETAQNNLDECVVASSEDIKNIEEGMSDSAYSISGGFVSNYSEAQIEEISAIFPTFTSPRVIAGRVAGAEKGEVVGLWGIQEFDYGWRILALDEIARQYSLHGIDVDDDSASGRVRDKMLDLASDTSAPKCAAE